MLLGMKFEEIEGLAKDRNLPSFRARQIAEWLYKKHVSSWEEMTNLPAGLREEFARDLPIGSSEPLQSVQSEDGTIKYLFAAGEGRRVETALIPDGERRTLCVSTQAGCRRGCKFCFTARSGFRGDLGAGAILNQYASCPERDSIRNIVFMGMGEPFDNTDAVLRAVEVFTANYGYAMSPTRLTVSTVGVMPGMRRYLEESRAHLAISLNSPFPEQRRELMPVERDYPIREVVKLLKGYDWSGQRRLTFEYIMFAGINDSADHAAAVGKLLRGLKCRLNLIPFNAGPGMDFQPSDRKTIENFQRIAGAGGVTTTIRKSKGADIAAACGQLSGTTEGVI